MNLTITEAMERARLKAGSEVDFIYNKIDSGDLEIKEAYEKLVSLGVESSIAFFIASEASGINFLDSI
jgi:hypothetical protein